MNTFVRGVIAVVLFSLLIQPAFAWGPDGHILITRVAAEKLPESMPRFFRRAGKRLEFLSTEPDRWRATDVLAQKNGQEPEHYIGPERVADFGELPPGRYDFIRRLYEKRAQANTRPDDFLPERVGLQPYITMELYGRLKLAFVEYRKLKEEKKSTRNVEQDAIFYAGILSHYIGDGSQPLHTTIYYNGWVGENPNGFTISKETHWSFENDFVKKNVLRLGFSDLMKSSMRLSDPFKDYQQFLWGSNRLVQPFYQLEKAGGFKDAGTAESLNFTRQCLASGAQMLLNFWYTAWVESEHPAPHPATQS